MRTPASQPRFGVSVVPSGHDLRSALELARAAEDAGLDFISVLDHPYNPVLADCWTMVTALAMATSRITVQTAVLSAPLRQPAILAKAAATLDRLADGRLEIGVGAGAMLDGIAAYGGPRLTKRESVDALREWLLVVRSMWAVEDTGPRDHRVGHYEGFGRALNDEARDAGWSGPISFPGVHHRLDEATPGPVPPHRIPLFVGGYSPKIMRIVGELGDGLTISHGRLSRKQITDIHARLDAAAEANGRNPEDIFRMHNLFGTIAESERVELGGRAGLQGEVGEWVDLLVDDIVELGFTDIQYYPLDDIPRMRRFAEDVVPAVREQLSMSAASQ